MLVKSKLSQKQQLAIVLTFIIKILWEKYLVTTLTKFVQLINHICKNYKNISKVCMLFEVKSQI